MKNVNQSRIANLFAGAGVCGLETPNIIRITFKLK